MNMQFVSDKIAWEKEREQSVPGTLPRSLCRSGREYRAQAEGRDIQSAINFTPYSSHYDKGRFAR